MKANYFKLMALAQVLKSHICFFTHPFFDKPMNFKRNVQCQAHIDHVAKIRQH